VALTSILVSFVMIADGLAMLLPGPSSAVGGAAILSLGLAWLVLGFPKLMSASGRSFSAILVSRFGLVTLPVLVLPVAGLWFVATPSALSEWFTVAWFAVWAVCLLLSAVLPCPQCRLPFGRRGLRFEIASSVCPHCGANPRPTST
jgi:hypothetical protein